MSKLEVLAAGFDLGNGTAVFSLLGKVISIPAGYCFYKPEGLVSNNGLSKPLHSYRVTLSNKDYWFGRDILGNSPVRKLDATKYDDTEYIRRIFSACVSHWAKRFADKSEVNPFDYRLAVVSGMPPGTYQDVSKKKSAQKAYYIALNNDEHTNGLETPWYIESSLLAKKERLHVEYLGLEPEGLVYQKVSRLKPGYNLIVDIGYGTLDIIVFTNSGNILLQKSVPMGMLNCFDKANPYNHNLAELETYVGNGDQRYIDGHLAVIQSKLVQAARVINTRGQKLNATVLGGGFHLMDSDYKNSLKGVFESVSFQNSSTNALCYEKIANKVLQERQSEEV